MLSLFKDANNKASRYVDAGSGDGTRTPVAAPCGPDGQPLYASGDKAPTQADTRGITGVTPIATPGRACIIIASAAGNIDITFADDSTLTGYPIAAGASLLPYSVKAIAPSVSNPATLTTVKGAK